MGHYIAGCKDISLTFAETKFLHKISELAFLDAVGLERLKDVVFDRRLVHDLQILTRLTRASLLLLQVT